MYYLNKHTLRIIFLGTCICFGTSFILSPVQAKTTKVKQTKTKIKKKENLVAIQLSAQEAQIVRQLMQQIELSTQELPIYLAISKPLEEITEHQKDPQKKVILRLSPENIKNLVLFLQRANIPSIGAKQVDIILKKVQKSLNKTSSTNQPEKQKDNTIDIQLTVAEIQLLQQMLDQIDINITEVDPFLDIYLPLEQANKLYQNPQQVVTLQLPLVGPKNLLIFLERTTLTGKHAKKAYEVIERLQQVVEAIANQSVSQPSTVD